jgi:thiol-disulfide isomerase/thioredoxin
MEAVMRLVIPLLVALLAAPAAATEPDGGAEPDSYAPAKPFAEAFVAEAAPQPAPETALLRADGPPVALSAFRGGPALLVFWATWCPVCREEMPVLAGMAPAFEAAGVSVIPVSVDKDPVAKISAHMAREMIDSLPLFVDSDHALAEAAGLRVLTTILFLDAQGRVTGRIEGRAPWDDPALLAYAQDPGAPAPATAE